MKKLIVISFILINTLTFWGQGLKTQGKIIIDKNGNEVILKGTGLGGWMLQEGYMMQSADIEGASTQHGFKKKLVSLIGETKTQEFYDAWLAKHVTKTDIDSLASWGFNSIRLPMHYNLFTLPIEEEAIQGQQTWLTKGFEMVDELLGWCKLNNIYLILDLHAAPGGQGYDAAISDYDSTKLSLWESSLNQQKTVALWRKLAERYKDEEWIGGYDLINETNWNMSNNSQLKSLYLNITNAIREVDNKHIIFIEGNWFANDFTGLTPPWDSNMVYSFHKYWSYNTQGSIQWMLDLRNQHNIPIWCGESGENSNVWFTDAIKLFEKNGIGWSWWPLKRFETTVSPFSIATNTGYKKILTYWKGQGAKPSVDEAYTSLMQITDNLLAENNTFNKDVVDAMLRQTKTDATTPFSKHTIPGIIHLTNYDLGSINNAYYDTNFANNSLDTGEFQAWNSGWSYRNDGVDIEKNNITSFSNGFHISHVKKGEWLKYSINVLESGAYTIKTRVASNESGGQFHLSLDGVDITSKQSVNSTGGWNTFLPKSTYNVILPEGNHELVFHIDEEIEFNILSIEFVKSAEIETVPFNKLNGYTTEDEKSIKLVLNHEITETSLSNLSLNDFQVKTNNISAEITGYQLSVSAKNVLIISLKDYLLYSDEIYLSYNTTKVKSVYNTDLPVFSNFRITNNLIKRHVIPGKIEVEDAFINEGFGLEDTGDVGGGKNFGYTDVGDYADYRIIVNENSDFKISCRVASANKTGQLGFYIVSGNSLTELVRVNTPITGGWQSWSTVSGNFLLEKGIYTIRMKVLSAGFNINWLNFEKIDADNDGVSDTYDTCPGTRSGAKVDSDGCEIFSISPTNYSILVTNATCKDANNGIIEIAIEDTSYNYIINVSGQNPVNYNSSTSNPVLINNLKTGNYTISVTIENINNYEQNFQIDIDEPEHLLAKSEVNSKTNMLSLELDGSNKYYVSINGIKEIVTNNFYSTQLKFGLNKIEVSTDFDCQGIFTEDIYLSDDVLLFPNPTKGFFKVLIPNKLNEVTLSIYSLDMKLLLQQKVSKQNTNNIETDISFLPAGVYLVSIENNQIKRTLKIIKI